MKKTFNINVAGYPFTIDDDAYQLLNDYITTVEKVFQNVEEGNEIIADIEGRIAELLLVTTADKHPIVTLSDVEEIISRIGQPEQMVEDQDIKINIDRDTESSQPETIEETVEINEKPGSTTTWNFPNFNFKKKLYRDPQNAMIGGVCSGLSWYLGIDVTWVRLIVVLLTLASASTVGIVYLVLWIVVPPADTPVQRMQMMGEEPTVENIGRSVKNTFRDEKTRRQEVYTANAVQAQKPTLGSAILKVLVIIGLIIGFPLIFACGIGILGCLFCLIMLGASAITGGPVMYGMWDGHYNMEAWYGILIGLGILLFIGIPLFFALRKGVRPNAQPLPAWLTVIMTLLCVAGFITAAVCTGLVTNL